MVEVAEDLGSIPMAQEADRPVERPAAVDTELRSIAAADMIAAVQLMMHGTGDVKARRDGPAAETKARRSSPFSFYQRSPS